MYYDKTYYISDYLNVQDMNDLVDKVKNLVEEMSTGKNLFSSEWEQGVVGGYGTNTPSTSGIRTKDYIPVIPNQHYAINRSILGNYINVRCYGSDKQYLGNGTNYITLISGSSAGNPMSGSMTSCVIAPKDNVYYLRFNDYTNDLSTQYMMVKGDTQAEYEPFIQILPPSNYDLDLPTYELNDFVFVEDIDKIERNIMNIGYDFFQPPGYIQNKIWRDWYETDVYKSFSADDLNRMITDMNILYSHKDERPTIYNLFTNENWDGETTLEWE